MFVMEMLGYTIASPWKICSRPPLFPPPRSVTTRNAPSGEKAIPGLWNSISRSGRQGGETIGKLSSWMSEPEGETLGSTDQTCDDSLAASHSRPVVGSTANERPC